MPLALQFIDSLRQTRLPRPGRPRQQQRVTRTDGHLFYPVDQLVESLTARGDARFQKRNALLPLLLKARRDAVVFRQVEINNSIPAGGLSSFAPRRHRRLNQLARKVSGLGQQEQANLLHVRPGGDVNQVFLSRGVEFLTAGEIVQRAVDFFQVPRVVELQPRRAHRRLRRDRADVIDDRSRQSFIALLVKHLEPLDDQIFLLAHGYRGPPAFPTLRPVAAVHIRPQHPNYDYLFGHRTLSAASGGERASSRRRDRHHSRRRRE